MLQEEKYFSSFKKSRLYIKLLAELDLLRENSLKETESNSIGEGKYFGYSFYSNIKMESVHVMSKIVTSVYTL